MTTRVVLTIQDNKGDETPLTIDLPAATGPEDAVLFAQQMAAIVEPMLYGRVLRVAVTMEVAYSGKVSPDVIADVQEKAKFTWRTVNGFIKRMSVPAFDETHVQPDGPSVLTGHTEVAAFISAMVDGIDVSGAGGSGVIEPCDSRGDDIAELEQAVEDWAGGAVWPYRR